MKMNSNRNKKQLHLLAKYTEREPVEIDLENKLEDLQAAVEGYIETVTLFSNLVIICNEEGRISHMPYNTCLMGIDFYGPVLIAGRKGDEFADTPINPEEYRILFSKESEDYYRARHYRKGASV